MAGRRGLTVTPGGSESPQPPDGFEDDGFGVPVPFEHAGLNLFRATGDMAALQDANFNEWSWTVYRLRTPEEMARAGTRTARVFVTKAVGPFDVIALQQHFGGGTYEIRGVFDGQLRIRHVQEIEGPRRQYNNPEPAPMRPFLSSNPPAAETLPQQGQAIESLGRILEAQGRMLEKITERLAAPAPAAAPAAPVQQGIGLADVIALADRMNQREVATPTGETIKEMMGVLRMGMNLNKEVVGGPAPTPTEAILEKVLPSLERIALGIFTGPRAARPVPGGRRVQESAAVPGSSSLPTPPPVIHHESSAQVIEAVPEPKVEAAHVEQEAGAHRWPAAIEALAKAISRGDDARDFPDTLELLLEDDDLAMLRAAPDVAVVAKLREAAGGAFPVLETAEGEAFIRGALAELRNPTDPEL